MLEKWLWPHRSQKDLLEEAALVALRRAVLDSPYLAASDLNEGFSGTQGFSLLFRRDQLARAKEHFPALGPYFDTVIKAEANAFFLNPLVIGGGGAVRPHADKTLESYLRGVPFPSCVSVLYLSLPTPRTGGRIVFHRWFGKYPVEPIENLLLEFPGWLKHEVTELKSDSSFPRVSVVLEQYVLKPDQLSALVPWHLDTNRSFDFFLEQAIDSASEQQE